MKRLMFVAISFLFLFTACQKDDSKPADREDSVLDYMPLKVGNYWVYNTYFCEPGEMDCELQSVDTNRVTKDTVINGNKFFKIEGQYLYSQGARYIRDSAEYLVDPNGNVLFSDSDFSSVFNNQTITSAQGDTIFYWYYMLTDVEDPVEVEAGTFDCLDMQGSIFRAMDDFEIEHHCHNYYAKGIGPVKQSSLFVSSLKVVKRELVSYHLEE